MKKSFKFLSILLGIITSLSSLASIGAAKPGEEAKKHAEESQSENEDGMERPSKRAREDEHSEEKQQVSVSADVDVAAPVVPANSMFRCNLAVHNDDDDSDGFYDAADSGDADYDTADYDADDYGVDAFTPSLPDDFYNIDDLDNAATPEDVDSEYVDPEVVTPGAAAAVEPEAADPEVVAPAAAAAVEPEAADPEVVAPAAVAASVESEAAAVELQEISDDHFPVWNHPNLINHFRECYNFPEKKFEFNFNVQPSEITEEEVREAGFLNKPMLMSTLGDIIWNRKFGEERYNLIRTPDQLAALALCARLLELKENNVKYLTRYDIVYLLSMGQPSETYFESPFKVDRVYIEYEKNEIIITCYYGDKVSYEVSLGYYFLV